MWIQKRRGEVRNGRRSIASLMVASIFYLTFLIHVNQNYIKYFKEQGMCHKTDKILKKNFGKNMEKKQTLQIKKCHSWGLNVQPPH